MNDWDVTHEDLAGPYILGSDGKSFTDAWYDNGGYQGC
jgi:hypothetical protein